MAEARAETILRILRKIHEMPKWTTSTKEPFETLVVTIISQNTADSNTVRAYEKLANMFEIKPEALAKAESSRIEASLRVAGLHRSKARTIKHVSRMILTEFHGDLREVLSLPFEEARRTLLRLPGIGPKTADVVLLFCAEKPTVPVDTHVYRLAKRLDFAPADADHEMVRASLQALFAPRDYLAVHVLLIQHGRRYCKSRKPLCRQCPLNQHCASRLLWDGSD